MAAEPAPKLDDDQGIEPDIRPNLGVIQGGGETVPGRGDLHSVSSSESEDEATPPSARERANDTWGMAPEDLQAREAGGDSEPSGGGGDRVEAGQLGAAIAGQIGPGYQEEPDKPLSRFRQGVLNLNRRQAMLGGGLAAGLISIIVVIFLSLLPLKLIHIVENLQNKFFATSNSAVEKYTEKLFSKYMSEHVLTAMNKPGCQSTRTITKDCINPIAGEGKVERLFRAWKDDRIETKLAQDYGIEFGYNSGAKKYYLKAPGIPSEVTIVSGAAGPKFDLNDMPEANRATIRAKIDEALQGETKWKKMLLRFKIGGLLERKYALRRCVFKCKTLDNFDEWKDKTVRNAAQTIVVDRVIAPHSDLMGFVFSCIVSGGCDSAPNREPGSSDNERRDVLEQKVKDYLDQRSIQYTDETVQKIVESSSVILDKGFQHFIIQKLTNEATADFVDKGVPVVGWINTVAKAIKTAANVGPQIRRWTYVLGSTAMVTYFMLAASHAGEEKSGNTNAQLAGSFVSMLGDQTTNGEPAENSPLYDSLLGDSSTAPQTALDLFSPSALAASPASTIAHYTCDNGSLIPVGQLICPEESLIADSFLTHLSDAFTVPPLNAVKTLADVWNNSAGQILGLVSSLGGSLLDLALKPFSFILDPAKNFMAEQTQGVFTAIATYFIPSPITDHMSGARAFNMLAGGADAAGSSYAQYGIGGKQLSTKTVMEIRNQQEQEQKSIFDSQPFFARMFDKSSPYSLVSQVAMAIPTNQAVGLQQSITSLLNPFSHLFSLSFMPKAHAAELADDPFGIPQFGYDPNGTAVNTDPSTLTDQYCQQANEDWANGTGQFAGTLVTDPATGTDVHTAEDPCMLLDAAVGSAGGFFDTSLLPADELGASSSTGTPNTGNASLYVLGDSLTVGMKSAGLDDQLKSKGWVPDSVGLVGRHLVGTPPDPDGLGQLDQDSSIVSRAGTVMVALGTNDFYKSDADFTAELQQVFSKIRSLNPNATLYWMNYAGIRDKAAPLAQKSALLADFAQQNNVRIIDWASVGAQYIPANEPVGVHPSGNYDKLVQVVVNAIGTP